MRRNTVCKILKELEPMIHKHVRECSCFSQDKCINGNQKLKNKMSDENNGKLSNSSAKQYKKNFFD